MGPIKADFQIVKLGEDQYDVLLFSNNSVLKSFLEVYPESILIQNSKFGKPLIAVANFPNKRMVEVFIEYWKKTFSDPEKSCQSCPTVRQFFAAVEKYSNPNNE